MSGWNEEWGYVYLERLALDVGDGIPTMAQVNAAKRYADAHIEKLKEMEDESDCGENEETGSECN